MKRFSAVPVIAVLGWVFAPVPASHAQQAADASAPPNEQIIVTAPKFGDAVISNFVKTYAAPAPYIGKIAQWRAPVCPKTIGLTPEFNVMVTERVRQVAAMIGVKADPKDPCKTNITIIFTPEPQAMLDAIKAKSPILLGYHDASQTDRLATMRYPVQAWYSTVTVDNNGNRMADDSSRYVGAQMTSSGSNAPCVSSIGRSSCGFTSFQLPPETAIVNARGTALSNGLSSEFSAVTILADTGKVTGLQIGAIADYVAMLALSQTEAFGTCKAISSIANLMSPDCDASLKPNAMTAADLAYLIALYKIQSDVTLQQQQSDIAGRMEKALEGH